MICIQLYTYYVPVLLLRGGAYLDFGIFSVCCKTILKTERQQSSSLMGPLWSS